MTVGVRRPSVRLSRALNLFGGQKDKDQDNRVTKDTKCKNIAAIG